MSRLACELGELIASSWRLGAGTTPIPTATTILHPALKQVEDHPALADFRNDFGFYSSTIGMRSSLLDEALAAAEDGLLLAPDGSTFTTWRVTLNEDAAAQCLFELGIARKDAVDLGRRLAAACDAIGRSVDSSPS